MDEKETSRLEAFSDGVFAVAITLLVLNIHIPLPEELQSSKDTLLMALLKQWPMLAAFVTSFATIGIMWMNHHRLFKHIARTDTGLLLINLLLLLVIVFIPVPTAILAEYLSGPDRYTAAALYSITFFLMACFFNLLWRYASQQNRLLDKNADQDAVRAISQQYLFGPLLYLIAIGLVWINVPVCIIFQFALALFFALPGRPLPLTVKKVEGQESEVG